MFKWFAVVLGMFSLYSVVFAQLSMMFWMCSACLRLCEVVQVEHVEVVRAFKVELFYVVLNCSSCTRR